MLSTAVLSSKFRLGLSEMLPSSPLFARVISTARQLTALPWFARKARLPRGVDLFVPANAATGGPPCVAACAPLLLAGRRRGGLLEREAAEVLRLWSTSVLSEVATAISICGLWRNFPTKNSVRQKNFLRNIRFSRKSSHSSQMLSKTTCCFLTISRCSQVSRFRH